MAALTSIILGTLVAAQTAQSVIGDRKNAKAARKTAGFEAGILEQQANDATLIGQEAANRAASSNRQLTGEQRVSQAAQGLDLSTGSAADVIASDAKLGELDVLQIQNNAAREALGLRKQASLVRQGGKNTATSYNNRSVGTLLSGAASLYSIYDAYGQNKTTPRKSSSAGGGRNPWDL